MATRTIGTEIVLSGEKQFNDAMKGVNNNLKNLKGDMALVSAEFDGNANSVEALTAKQKILQTSVEQHRAKVDALQKMYDRQKEKYGENSAAADKYRQELTKATTALIKEERALKTTEDALEDSKSSANKLGKAIDNAGKVGVKALGGIGSAAGSAAKGLGSAASAAVTGAAAAASSAVAVMENLVSMAREAADSAKAAFDAGETLTESQQQWLAYSNQLGSLDASVSGAKNALTSILLPVLGELASDGSAFLGDFTRDMNAAAGDTGAQTKVLTDYVVKGANLIKEKLPEYVAMGKEIVGGLLEGLGESAPELIEIAMDLVQYLFDGICEYAPQIAEAGIGLIQMLLESLISRGPDFVDSAAKMIADLVTGLAEAAPTLIPTAMQLIMQLVLALAENAPLLLEAGLELVLGIINGLVAGLSDFESSASDIVNALITGFTEAGPKILAIGGDIVRGIWDGISQGTEWILGKIETWVGSVLDWIKEKLGIHSPSAVMRDQVGIWMARGIGQGFVDEMSKINKMMADSIDTSFDLPEFRYGARRYSGRNYVTGSGKTVNLYITAKSITESDISMLLDLVNRKLGESM